MSRCLRKPLVRSWREAVRLGRRTAFGPQTHGSANLMFSKSTLLLLFVAAGPGCVNAGLASGASVRASADAFHDDEAFARPTSSPKEMVAEERRASRRFASRSAPRRDVESPPPSSDASSELAHAMPEDDTAEPAIEAPEHSAHDRQIVYTASMRMSVFNLEEAAKKVEGMPERFGGYVHAMSHGHMVMRIPSTHLRPAMEELATLGVVEQRSLQAQDVTAEYVDIDARIRVLEETQKQMIELLSKARTVDEALAVRRALDQITMELEVLQGRMRQLRNMIAFSTLTVDLTERGPHVVTPSSRDPFPWVDDLGVEATEWN
jgi:hypothetical protein